MKVSLFSPSTAFNSLRSSGFDFSSSVGELLDNSIQAESKNISINLTFSGNRITELMLIDDGIGMDVKTLHHSLSLGFSTRYDDRRGIGRFGVGSTLGAISQCKRIEIVSGNGSAGWHRVYVDLDEINNSGEAIINEPIELAEEEKKKYKLPKRGTVVFWKKCDRLEWDANGKPLNGKKLEKELQIWVERAYRYYISQGVTITLNKNKLIAYDPLYSMVGISRKKDEPSSEVRFDHTLEWPIPNTNEKSRINIKIVRLPDSFLQSRFEGGSKFAEEHRIDTNEGISVLRMSREVAYGNFYPMVPKEQAIDRYWGMEIHFDAQLDECWEVRHIKRGARPTEALRIAIRDLVSKPIADVRRHIQRYWDQQEVERAEADGLQNESELLVAKAESRLKPKAEGHQNIGNAEAKKRISGLVGSPLLTDQQKKVLSDKIEVKDLPITVTTMAMAGSEFIETTHLGNGKVNVAFNYSHPFFDMYNAIKNLERNSTDEVRAVVSNSRRTIELLLMAYGRAESMIDLSDPVVKTAIDTLRSYWGSQLKQYINQNRSN